MAQSKISKSEYYVIEFGQFWHLRGNLAKIFGQFCDKTQTKCFLKQQKIGDNENYVDYVAPTELFTQVDFKSW